jgi:hypothetical protein
VPWLHQHQHFEWLRHGYGDDLMAMAAMFVVVGVAAVYGVTGV